MMKKVDKDSTIPLYAQMKDILIMEIQNNRDEYDKLESEREICEKYNVSRTTVRQALDELEREKYIYKVHGKGNFILHNRVEQDLIRFYSFTNEMIKIGRKPHSEVIGFSLEEVDGKIARIISKNKKQVVYKVVRIRLADDIPMMYEITYLPYERFKELTKEMLEEKPMYEVFLTKFDAKITSAEEYLVPVLANKLESIYLDISEGVPCLKIERITYDNKQVIEYTVSIARGDQFKYKIHLENK